MKKVDRRSFLKTAAYGVAAFGLASANNDLMAGVAHSTKSSVIKNGNKSWSLIILPDTQYYSHKYPGLLHLQTQWILENKDKYNIVYVLQTGDVTNNNLEIQWQRASQAFARLDGKVPYAISLGNHDFGFKGETQDRTTLANNYFPVLRFEKMPTFGCPMEADKINNTFHTFNVAGQNYLILCLEFGPRNEALEWANQIVEKHANHKVIILTHAYLYSDSTRYDWQMKKNKQEWNPHDYPIGKSEATTVNDGQEMWNKLIKKWPNIFMTINGHVLNDGLGYLASQGDNGNKIHQMLVNFQMLQIGGEAWLRILNFQPEEKIIKVQDYSPLYENFDTDSDNQYSISLDN
jgi:ribonuclease HI